MTVVLRITRDAFRIDGTFTIARGSRTVAEVLTVHLESTAADGRRSVGRGECMPYARYGESLDSVTATIESVRDPIERGADREALQTLLPAGAARNALDCALWDLEAKTSGTPVWQLAGIDAPRPVVTAYTLSLESPEDMRTAAAAQATRPLLKIKLGGDGATDIARLEAVRRGAPDARLVVDANEGWALADYDNLAAPMLALGVALVEQPLPAGEDEALAGRAAEGRRAVHLGRLHLLAVERLDCGEQDQGGERQPLPGDDERDREQRRAGRERVGADPRRHVDHGL